MNSPQVARFAKIIREKLPTHASVDAAVHALREDIEAMRGDVPAAMESDLLRAQEEVRKSMDDVEILHRNSIIKVREKWYAGPAPESRHWPALKGFLQNGKGWDHESVESIDSCSSEIVSLLANPVRDQFHCRGLVVGYVQSGKTANMTAVIAKAVDAGYNLVVLLGGMTNKLRAQTQRRIEEDVVSRHRPLWQLYTTADDDGDFSIPANGQFTLPRPGFAQLAVMKKEKSRLEAFLKTLMRTTPHVVRSLKALVIDDECDQASVNAAAEEYDITAINEAIRKMLRALPAASYAGYTATPFANVFINPFPHNHDELDDLYPEDFITSLPRPDGYFGAREVFGFDPEDAQDESSDSEGHDMVRVIPPEEVVLLRPSGTREREAFYPELTDELERALLWFLLSCAVRRRRGQGENHMTMLVHASQYVIQHERMDEVIRKWLDDNRADIASGTGGVWQRLEDVWEAETGRVPLEAAEETDLQAKSLLPWLEEAIDAVQVVVENSVSEERLDYTEEAKTYIVVGGSVLARGLTLEGLTVSFFLRTSRQYDTLLQMGRWFGFRHGYEDLPTLVNRRPCIQLPRAGAHRGRNQGRHLDLSGQQGHTSGVCGTRAVHSRPCHYVAREDASRLSHEYQLRRLAHSNNPVRPPRSDYRVQKLDVCITLCERSTFPRRIPRRSRIFLRRSACDSSEVSRRIPNLRPTPGSQAEHVAGLSRQGSRQARHLARGSREPQTRGSVVDDPGLSWQDRHQHAFKTEIPGRLRGHQGLDVQAGHPC